MDLKVPTYGGKDIGSTLILQQFSTSSPTISPTNPYSTTPTTRSNPDSPSPIGLRSSSNNKSNYNCHTSIYEIGQQTSNLCNLGSQELSRASCKGSQELYNPTYEEISPGKNTIKFLLHTYRNIAKNVPDKH